MRSLNVPKSAEQKCSCGCELRQEQDKVNGTIVKRQNMMKMDREPGVHVLTLVLVMLFVDPGKQHFSDVTSLLSITFFFLLMWINKIKE